ncbi:MAG: hypothetical protein PHD83_01075 [Caldisericia bacterium]|nr:hypothetical protein [Caldisericia bacterium]
MPEVITEGKTIEECRELLKDALHEIMVSYQEKGYEMPSGRVQFAKTLFRNDLRYIALILGS